MFHRVSAYITAVSLIVICIITSFVLFMASESSAEGSAFRLGFLPSERATELTPKAEALGKFLEKRLNIPVEIIVPTSYEPLIEGLRFGHIDAAFMDSGPGWLAHKKTGAEVVLSELKKGRPFYYGEVYAAADSELQSIDDAIGKRIAFTSWTGSSGFIFPIGSLIKRGHIKPTGDDFVSLEKALEESFETFIVAGGYKQALTLLIEGKVDVAAGAHDAREKYLDPENRDKIKPIERLGKVPSHPVMVRKNLDETLRENFVAAMLELNDEANLPILKNIYGVDGLVATNTEDHLSDFGPAFESLTGVHDKVYAKRK